MLSLQPSNGRARNVTMQDIADAVGVSKAAVSQALAGRGRISQAKRQVILETAEQLGFEPDPHAQRLSMGRFENLISLFSLDLDLGTETLKLSFIEQRLRERGFDVSLHAFGFGQLREPAKAQELLRQVCRNKPRAIICNSRELDSSTSVLLDEFQQSGGSVVCYDNPVDLRCDKVIFDRAANSRLAARHLIEMGHHHLGMHLGHRHPRDKRFIAPRQQAFAQTVKEAGLSLPPKHIFYSEKSYEEAGWDVARQFLALAPEERPSALYIVNDHAAAAFVHAVMREGVRVPEDISVVSDDDLPAARSCLVPLTAVTQPVLQIAEVVVDSLVKRLESPAAPPAYQVIKGELVMRESVARISL